MPGEAVRVPAVRLSRYVTKPVDFLKLDVEGSELPVLRDLASSGAIGQIRQMVIEFHHHMSPDVDNLSECLSILEQQRLRLSADVGTGLHADHARAVSGRAGARVSEVAVSGR